MNEHWKAASNYIISLLSMMVILVIAWLIKKFFITTGGSNALGVTGLSFIVSGLLANGANLKLDESPGAISSGLLNKWLHGIFLAVGFFFMLLWIL